MERNNITLKQGDCVELIKELEDNSIDCILTDPPYLYLKHKLDRQFDETEYFNQVKRALKDTGFIVLFGRGSSFYRWNTILSDLDFIFKEEIIWNKKNVSNPLCQLHRYHETISIHSKKPNNLNRCRVDYFEIRSNEEDTLKKILNDLRTIKNALNKSEHIERLVDYLEKNVNDYVQEKKDKHSMTMRSGLKVLSDDVQRLKQINEGITERSIISVRTEYDMIHPTQKPVRLIERLLNLVTKENDLVLDTFMGSGSTGIACINLNRNFIGYEIDSEYFQQAKKRLEERIKDKEIDNKQICLFEE